MTTKYYPPEAFEYADTCKYCKRAIVYDEDKVETRHRYTIDKK
jgi:hypothetical protein